MEIDHNEHISILRGMLYDEQLDLRTIEYVMTRRTNDPPTVYLRDHVYEKLFPRGDAKDSKMWNLLSAAIEHLPWHSLELLLGNTEIQNVHHSPVILHATTHTEYLLRGIVEGLRKWAFALGVLHTAEDGRPKSVVKKDAEYLWRCCLCHTLIFLFDRWFGGETLDAGYIPRHLNTSGKNTGILRFEGDDLVSIVGNPSSNSFVHYRTVGGVSTISLASSLRIGFPPTNSVAWRCLKMDCWETNDDRSYSWGNRCEDPHRNIISTINNPLDVYIREATRSRRGDASLGERPDMFYGNPPTLMYIAAIMQSYGLRVPQRIKDLGFATDWLTPIGTVV